MHGSLEVLLIGLLFVICLAVYFIPTWIAYEKSHPQRLWILVFNLFGGATIIVWIACLVWAVTYHSQDPEPRA
jgi:RsiW-degrading membrane proteinase PrsW (M82 family)